MYKNKNRYNDLINKYHYLEPLEKPRVYEGSVNTTHNLLVTQPKYLTALYFSMSNIFLQKPAIKKANKSYASFKLRENMAIGTVSTFHGDMLNNFYYLTLVGVLPNINKTSGFMIDMCSFKNVEYRFISWEVGFLSSGGLKLTEYVR